jgi:hypothetical protein
VVAIGGFAVANVVFLRDFLEWARQGLPHNDWQELAPLDPTRPFAGFGYHWSVPAAWIWAGLVVPMGFGLWTALHFLALATIRSPVVIVIALATFPFWHDVVSGNVMTFVVVAAWHALRGSRAGIVAYVALAVLVPRPLMLPVLGWLLMREPIARWAFAIGAAVVIGWALAQGELVTWIARLAMTSGPEMAADFNLAPSRWIGISWLLVAWPVAAWAFWRGRLGLASVLVAPYAIGYYLAMLLLDYTPSRAISNIEAVASATTAAESEVAYSST